MAEKMGDFGPESQAAKDFAILANAAKKQEPRQ